MADNIEIAPGVTAATDEIGGVHHQRVKLQIGDDGAASDVSAANPLPVSQSFAAASVVHNQQTVGTSAVQLATATARRFRIRALLGQSGVIYLGGSSSVSASNGFPLWPGDVTPPLELSNLNVLWAIASEADQKIAYLGEV